MQSFIDNAGTYIHANPWFGLVAVFLGGVLTASSPCVLAMIPLMMSFVAGRRDGRTSVGRAFGLSLIFVLGLSLTFTAMGMVAALAGKMYGEIPALWHFVVAAVCVVMGLHLAGVRFFEFPALTRFKPKAQGALGAFVLGLLFGLVSAPCAAPILVVLLTYLAGSGASVVYGGGLLLTYALGHSVLIIAAGTSMGAAKRLIESKRAVRASEILRRVAGGTIVLIGLFFAYQGFK